MNTLKEKVVAFTKWRETWKGKIENDDDWFIRGIEYASGEILKTIIAHPSEPSEEPIAWLGYVDQGMGHGHYEVVSINPDGLYPPNTFPVYKHPEPFETAEPVTRENFERVLAFMAKWGESPSEEIVEHIFGPIEPEDIDTFVKQYVEELRELRLALTASAAEKAAPDMKAIMAGNGHPDEGPCVVCGHVFDAHEPGCAFEPSDATGLTWKDGLLVVWLIWVWKPEGWFELRSVSLTADHAALAKKTINIEHAGWKVIVEESRAQHIFAESFSNFHRQDGLEPPNGYDGPPLTASAAEKAAPYSGLREAIRPFAEMKPPDAYFDAEYITCGGKGWSGGTHVPWSAVLAARKALQSSAPQTPKEGES